MPAKKAASKKRKKTTTSKKKVVAKKSTSKKPASRKRKVVKKKPSPAKKTASKKKSVSKKKAVKKKVTKVTKKKAAAKKVSKKKVAKKAPAKKKVSSKKKVAKKAPSRKAPSKKAPSKKAPAKKKVAASRPAAKKAVRKPAAPRARTGSNLLSGPIHGIEPYKPRRGEDYMSDVQLEHFNNILSAWKRELMFEVDRTVHHMQDEAANFPDPNDRATQESEFGLELRTRDRERKLLRKIDQALARIKDGSYGWCDETGEEIGLKRLEARPVATMCLEAQERRELAERQFRDRDDRYR
jgi:DnaK suppressor protein